MFVPIDSKPGGFTITSSPSEARPCGESPGYLELAIQNSPESKPAFWLWWPADKLIGQAIDVRVGGSFVWPPVGVDVTSIKKVIFIAGGMGVNPLMSMLSHIADGPRPPFEIHFLYTARIKAKSFLRENVPFLERLAHIFMSDRVRGVLKLVFTGDHDFSFENGGSGDHVLPFESGGVEGEDGQGGKRHLNVSFQTSRLGYAEIESMLGPVSERMSSIAYICGPPTMTDSFVEYLTRPDGAGLDIGQVKYEKWW